MTTQLLKDNDTREDDLENCTSPGERQEKQQIFNREENLNVCDSLQSF